MEKIIPNFFIIGAPKCGTTSLSEYLRPHPNIFISNPKEPLHFHAELPEHARMDRQTYLALFAKADPSVHRAVGEASASYLSSESAVPEILKFNPGARFIAMLRNPVDMVQSLHAQKVFEGRENILDLESAWRMEEERKKQDHLPSGWEASQLFYSQWCLLGRQVKRLLSRVPKDRVQIVLFDDFVSDTRRTYSEVLSFLEIPDDGRVDFPKINENKEVRWPWLQQGLAFLKFNAEIMKKRLGLTGGWGITSRMLEANSRPSSRKSISESFLEELSDFYRDDVRELSGLLGRDLSRWVDGNRVNAKKAGPVPK